MTDKKFVPFDYQRYLDGDEVYYRNGEKFSGEIFLSKINKKWPLITDEENIGIRIYNIHGYIHNEVDTHLVDLVMRPKTKKLWIAVAKNKCGGSYHASHAYEEKQELPHYICDEQQSYQIVEIEIEV